MFLKLLMLTFVPKQIAKIMTEIKDRFVARLALQRQLNLLEKVSADSNKS